MRIDYRALRDAGICVEADDHGVNLSLYHRDSIDPHPIVGAMHSVIDGDGQRLALTEHERDQLACAVFDAYDKEMVTLLIRRQS